MRLLLLVAAVAIAPAGSAQLQTPLARLDVPLAAPVPIDCPKTTSHHAMKPGDSLKLQKLGELPPANAYAAVYRQVGGCEVPVIVRYNVGGR